MLDVYLYIGCIPILLSIKKCNYVCNFAHTLLH